MKRIVLICIVALAVAWTVYSSYELWLNDTNELRPELVFCDADESVLLIQRYNETMATDYLEMIQKNPLASTLSSLSYDEESPFSIYASGNRPILIFEKSERWKKSEIETITEQFKQTNTTFKHHANWLLIAQDFKTCQAENNTLQLNDGDKKASANFWIQENNQWKRTDVYNLEKGFYEYQSSAPENRYGEAVKDIPLFSSVLPNTLSDYQFTERFYAEENDSIFKNGPMNEWVDKGFVSFHYEGSQIIVSDYRSQQVPNLILIEKSKNEDSIIIDDDLNSYIGFQLTKNFPASAQERIYGFEIEDKAFFTTSKAIARKIQVEYQLGKTLSLNPEKEERFFKGLPSLASYRVVSAEQKMSITWKDKLLFEVNTRPPQEQLHVENKTTWSVAAKDNHTKIVPIYDHLRGGISAFTYTPAGDYELIGPNGQKIWNGKLTQPIQGEVQVIDVFNNDKLQLLFASKNKVFLIDLNGSNVGGFPYQTDQEITTGISDFVWNGTKRFLVGTTGGEIIMLNSAGRELNIIQAGNAPIAKTSYALNIKGNLRAWAINSEGQEILGYLERPAKAAVLGKTIPGSVTKQSGKVINYFDQEGEVFYQHSDATGKRAEEPKLLDQGEIVKITPNHLVIHQKNEYKILNHQQQIIFNKTIPFNEVGLVHYLPEKEVLFVLDDFKNKIHAYNKVGDELEGFPKEGRNILQVGYDSQRKTIYLYTLIERSIICYKL